MNEQVCEALATSASPQAKLCLAVCVILCQGRIQAVRLGGDDFRNIWQSSVITGSLL